MKNQNIEIRRILDFTKNVLNKKKIYASDFIFHSADACNDKVFVLTRASIKNINEYINLANKKDIKAIIIDKKIAKNIITSNIPILVSPFLNKYLNIFLSELYDHPLKGVKVIGVTGTDGKTSMINMLAQAFRLLGKKVGVISTEGNGVYPTLKKSAYTTPVSYTHLTLPTILLV